MTTSTGRTLVSFDWAMKSLLRDKANFDVLEGFLTTLLGEEIKVLWLLESESNQRHEADKFNRVDLLVENAQKEIILIEIQHNRERYYLKRMLYGAANLVVDNRKLGESFAKGRKVISISILYFVLAEGSDDYIYHGYTEFYGFHSKKPLQFGETVRQRRQKESVVRTLFPEYYLIEVERFQNVIRSAIDEWIYFFKNSEIRDEFHSKNIQHAREKLDVLKMEDIERRAYERYLIEQAIEQDVLQTSYSEGEARGKAEGKAEGERNKAWQIARSMLAEGVDVALITRVTGLSTTELTQAG